MNLNSYFCAVINLKQEKVMKKVFLLCALLFTTFFSVFAQKDEKSIGLNLGYGTEIKSLGIGAKFNYNITDPIQLSPSFNYFLKKDGLSMWELNADVHYLFPITEKLKVYPLAGLTLTGWKMSGDGFDDSDIPDWMKEYMDDDDYDMDGGSSSTTKFGINLGGGVSYDITNTISIGAELKYSLVSDFDQVVFGVNATYKF